MVEMTGIEPASSASGAAMLPLHHTPIKIWEYDSSNEYFASAKALRLNIFYFNTNL
jgi:hypothetical protein